MLSSLQLARLVQLYLAEPGASVDEKAAVVGVRRNVLLRAARGTISPTARARLLAHFAAAPARRPGRFFAGAGARRVKDARVPAIQRAHRQRKRGFT